MPEHVYYRQAVEAITQYRLNLIRDPSLNVSHPVRSMCGVLYHQISVLVVSIQRDDVEETMNCQVEQLIEMAKDELELIPQYACKTMAKI